MFLSVCVGYLNDNQRTLADLEGTGLTGFDSTGYGSPVPLVPSTGVWAIQLTSLKVNTLKKTNDLVETGLYFTGVEAYVLNLTLEIG